ncbi:MAG: hypothetical protein HC814_03780, partial [Rhodobacteraceae bacterium]|nr:hypothetical protein [Paracoccaceae bacterium]
MGRHVVLDTTPADRAKTFTGLPESVTWVHDPIYGSGWKAFRFRAALERSLEMARRESCEIVVQLDCDEYYSEDSVTDLFPYAKDAMVSAETIHWKRNLVPYSFGDSEYHVRIWPSYMNVIWPINAAWVASPHYNGNPDHHAMVHAPLGAKTVRVDGHYHYHLHYAVGEKAKDEETAHATIQGWPNGKEARSIPIPPLIINWIVKGEKPSLRFMA